MPFLRTRVMNKKALNLRDGLPSNDVERSDLRRSSPLTDLRHDTAFTSDLATLALTSTDGVKDILRHLAAELGLSSGRCGLADGDALNVRTR